MDMLWTAFLDLLSQVVTPLWDTLLQYIPLLFLILLPLALLGVARMWGRNAARNRSRVVRPAQSGPLPDGVHLPSPSIWPLIGPIGLFLMFLGVVLGGEAGPNVPLVVVGLGIGAIAALGWLRDAGREYHDTAEGHGHGARHPSAPRLAPAPRPIPEGVHLPAPSAWPLLAPIGIFFVFLGLVLGPLLILAGLVMGVIAAIGWLRDAGREYHDLVDGAHPDPDARDPVRRFPHALVPVYAAVGAVAILLTLGPWLLSLLPGSAVAGGEDEGPAATTTPYVSAVSVLSFEQDVIVVPADQPFTITFENKQAGVPHNVEILGAADPQVTIYLGDIIDGPATIDYPVQPLAAAVYPFRCTVHPPMTGELRVVEG